ncbi:melanoma-associated antigen B5-like [Molossus nigricans]
MPRRLRSKHHNNQKSQRAQDEVQIRRIFEVAATVGEEPPSSSSPVLEDNPESSSATEATSTAQESWRVPPIYIPSSVAFPTSSEDGQDEDYSWSQEGLSPENSCCDPLTVQVTILEKFLSYKYRVKQPILWEDMLNIVNERYHRYFADILKKASESIEVLFGADLKEVDSTRHSYDLVSKLKLPNNGRVRPGRGLPKTGLLMNILGMIFLNGNRASEEELWEFLNAMRLFPGKKHYIYGEPRKLITKELVKLKYLEYRQVPDSDPPRYEFLWGPKAHLETSKMKVLEFWAKVNDIHPSAFPGCYEEALRDHEEKVQARDAARAATTAKVRPAVGGEALSDSCCPGGAEGESHVLSVSRGPLFDWRHIHLGEHRQVQLDNASPKSSSGAGVGADLSPRGDPASSSAKQGN